MENFKEELIKEIKYLAALFTSFLVIFMIVFYKENFVSNLSVVSSIFYVFILPGFFLVLYLIKELNFMERIVIGSLISIAVMSISSYYIGMTGINIRYTSFILPIFFIFIGLWIFFTKTR